VRLHTLTGTVLTVIAVIGEYAHGEKVDSTAFDFESRHLSVGQCDNMNYTKGRKMEWSKTDESLVVTTIADNEEIDERQKAAVQKVPAWVQAILKKGETYQTEKKEKDKKYQDRLSGYSETELSIADNMGLDPWDIDRKLLKLWGRETDSVLSKQ
jgi:hypothetical protein